MNRNKNKNEYDFEIPQKYDDIIKLLDPLSKFALETFNNLNILPPLKNGKTPRASWIRIINIILEIVPVVLYVKIWKKNIMEFLFIGNSENISEYHKDFVYKIYLFLEKTCKNREIIDCEFLINFLTPFPILKKKYPIEKHIGIFSVNTNEEFDDITFLSYTDLERSEKNVFGIKLPNSVIWEYKKLNFCIGIPISEIKYSNNIYAKKLLKENKSWDTFDEIDKTYKKENSVSKYKFILLFDTYGNPENITDILYTGSCIIKAESNFKSWYDINLVPWIHYIPVKNNLEDLETIKQWCLDNDKECENIGLNARHFAINNFSTNSMTDIFLKNIENLPGLLYHNTLSDIQMNLQLEEIKKSIIFIKSTFSKNDNIINTKLLTSSDKNTWAQNTAIHMLFNNIEHDKLENISNYNIYIHKTNLYNGVNDAFIGIKCINELCREIPNFLFTYFCDVYEDGFKIYKEKLNKSISFEKFLNIYGDSSEIPNKNIIEVFLQIFLSLQMAYENYGFEHGNLIVDNIKVVLLSEEKSIKYQLSDKLYLLTTKFLVVIENFAKSKCITNFWYNKDKMITGRIKEFDNIYKLPDDFENYLVPKPYKDIVTLSKSISRSDGKNKIGQKLINLASKDITDQEPITIMNKSISPSIVKEKKVKFGPKNPQTLEENIPALGYPRLIYDKAIGVKNPHLEVINRGLENALPNANNKIGNIILQYEMSHNLQTALLDIKMNYNFNVNVTKSIEKYLIIIKKYYNELIENTFDNNLFIDRNDDLWTFKMFIRKYYLLFANNANYMKLLQRFAFIMVSTIKTMISHAVKNTENFYEQLNNN